MKIKEGVGLPVPVTAHVSLGDVRLGGSLRRFCCLILSREDQVVGREVNDDILDQEPRWACAKYSRQSGSRNEEGANRSCVKRHED